VFARQQSVLLHNKRERADGGGRAAFGALTENRKRA